MGPLLPSSQIFFLLLLIDSPFFLSSQFFFPCFFSFLFPGNIRFLTYPTFNQLWLHFKFNFLIPFLPLKRFPRFPIIIGLIFFRQFSCCFNLFFNTFLLFLRLSYIFLLFFLQSFLSF